MEDRNECGEMLSMKPFSRTTLIGIFMNSARSCENDGVDRNSCFVGL